MSIEQWYFRKAESNIAKASVAGRDSSTKGEHRRGENRINLINDNNIFFNKTINLTQKNEGFYI